MQINSNYTLIDNKKSFELSLVKLLGSSTIAIDTESSGFYTYFSRVCLIQITCAGKNYIFDPLSNINISALGSVMKSPNILKIFHSASDDIKALKRDFNFEFHNVCDTMYSSKLLGMEHNSLEHLVDYYHKVKLSKTQQKSNWEIRPLKDIQLQYAALDTAYLESIWADMKVEMERLNLFEEANSEFERMANEPFVKKDEIQPLAWHKFPDIISYSPEERRLIVEILTFREEKARKANKAPFRILSKETIDKIVKEKPDINELTSLFGKKDAESLSAILSSTGEPIYDVSHPRMMTNLNEEEEILFSRLKKWREKVISHRHVDHSMLLSNKQLILILQQKPTSTEDLEKLNIMSKWKIENYGQGILNALKNESYDDQIKKLVQIKKSKNKKKSNYRNNQFQTPIPKSKNEETVSE
jgi:ribonuclease D